MHGFSVINVGQAEKVDRADPHASRSAAWRRRTTEATGRVQQVARDQDNCTARGTIALTAQRVGGQKQFFTTTGCGIDIVQQAPADFLNKIEGLATWSMQVREAAETGWVQD